MGRSHRDVGAAEVEERCCDSGVVVAVPQHVEAGKMITKRRLEGVLQQVLYSERLGEVRAGGFAGP